jgi:hypothetical protein
MKTQLEVNGNQYSISKLSPMMQFNVVRRLAPLLAQMGVSLQTIQSGISADLTDFLPALGPITNALAKISDDDANYIIFTCLEVVSRQSGEKWSRITSGMNLMYDDIDMPTMLRLVVEVLKVNLGSFMQGLPDVTK